MGWEQLRTLVGVTQDGDTRLFLKVVQPVFSRYVWAMSTSCQDICRPLLLSCSSVCSLQPIPSCRFMTLHPHQLSLQIRPLQVQSLSFWWCRWPIQSFRMSQKASKRCTYGCLCGTWASRLDKGGRPWLRLVDDKAGDGHAFLDWQVRSGMQHSYHWYHGSLPFGDPSDLFLRTMAGHHDPSPSSTGSFRLLHDPEQLLTVSHKEVGIHNRMLLHPFLLFALVCVREAQIGRWI